MVFVGAATQTNHASVANDVDVQNPKTKQIKDISQKLSDDFKG